MIDARIGGNIYSATTANLYKAGNAAGTVINGTREEFVVPNSVTSDGMVVIRQILMLLLLNCTGDVLPEVISVWVRHFYMMLLIFVYVILPLVMI